MANIKSAIKRARQNITHRAHNAGLKSRMRTHIKHVLKAIVNGEKEQAQKALTQAQPVIDSMCNKKLIHKNKAAPIQSLA